MPLNDNAEKRSKRAEAMAIAIGRALVREGLLSTKEILAEMKHPEQHERHMYQDELDAIDQIRTWYSLS